MTSPGRLVPVAAVLVSLAACRREAPLARCADPLGGLWRADATAPSGEPIRWSLLDGPRGVEGFADFDDSAVVAAAGVTKPTTADAVIAAPGALDLHREPGRDALVGSYARRFQRGAQTCTLRTPARLHDCRGDRAVLDVSPPAPPADWTLCTPAPSTPRIWHLVRE